MLRKVMRITAQQGVISAQAGMAWFGTCTVRGAHVSVGEKESFLRVPRIHIYFLTSRREKGTAVTVFPPPNPGGRVRPVWRRLVNCSQCPNPRWRRTTGPPGWTRSPCPKMPAVSSTCRCVAARRTESSPTLDRWTTMRWCTKVGNWVKGSYCSKWRISRFRDYPCTTYTPC